MQSVLETGIQQLKDDKTNGARVLATNALETLHQTLFVRNNDDDTRDEPSGQGLWRQLRISVIQLSRARPSMAAAITSALIKSLAAIQARWTKELGVKWKEVSQADDEKMRSLAQEVLLDEIELRRESSTLLAQAFVKYIHSIASANNGRLRILTLSSSSTLLECLSLAVRECKNTHFLISILESRPRMEGATFATDLLAKVSSGDPQASNINIIIAPESHVCALAKDTDILVLGADRISTAGDVSNKMGSFAAALAAKSLKSARVVIVSETDKIARPGLKEEQADEDNDPEEVISAWPEQTQHSIKNSAPNAVTVRNVYFEWVPHEYVDTYITEIGILAVEQVKTISEKKGVLEDELFDG